MFSKVILDPNLDWDKSFLSPASSKKSKASLDDKATFWKPPASSRAKDAKEKALTATEQSDNGTPCNPYSCKPKAKSGFDQSKPKARVLTTSMTKSNCTKITSFFNKDGSMRCDSVHSKSTNSQVVSKLAAVDNNKENAAY